MFCQNVCHCLFYNYQFSNFALSMSTDCMCLFLVLSSVLLINSQKVSFGVSSLKTAWWLYLCDSSLYVIHVPQFFDDICMFLGCMWLCWCLHSMLMLLFLHMIECLFLFCVQCATWSCTNHLKFCNSQGVRISPIFWHDLVYWEYGRFLSLYVLFLFFSCMLGLIILCFP